VACRRRHVGNANEAATHRPHTTFPLTARAMTKLGKRNRARAIRPKLTRDLRRTPPDVVNQARDLFKIIMGAWR
jgi:hypothetical protein